MHGGEGAGERRELIERIEQIESIEWFDSFVLDFGSKGDTSVKSASSYVAGLLQEVSASRKGDAKEAGSRTCVPAQQSGSDA